ncbi:N-6 DNA methylase [Geomonas sp. Red69]|uniref:N-6 DNA methylase n=1 Tax=Geomonas diazotrophica TaxID=2843197 RepID=UPI001C11654C|nr:N-6 DNA methylase [Geomonas diazotrophica]MBU5637505.1 N-6 DNA methylase [Geomonas diazotrophica]
MSAVNDKSLQDITRQIVNRLLAEGLSGAVIREVFAALFVLRWIDNRDVEQEAMSIFEDRSYQPLLPSRLQWRNWAQLDNPYEIAAQFRELTRYLEARRGDTEQPLRALVHMLPRVLEVDFVCLHDLVRWVATLPFDMVSERRALLSVFDQMVAQTTDAYDGQFSSPASIALLVAVLANPEPGEKVYDPCFGSGNFLLAAWQQAERNHNESRRQWPSLEVAGIELNPSAFLIGLTRMLLAGIDSPSLELGNSLEREAPSSSGRGGFDVVVADPPIGAKVGRQPWGCQHFAFVTNDSTGLFIQHALSQLKAHGRAVIVVPEGFLFRGGVERELRRYLVEHGQVEAVISLPAGAFAPYTSVKGSLLLLRKQGGVSRVRIVDAAPLFDRRSGREAPTLHSVLAQQLVTEIRRPELRTPLELQPGIAEGTPGTGVLSRSIWEVGVEDLAAADWDLSPRRREKGGLNELLTSLTDALGETGTVVTLATVVQVSTGRSINSSNLLDKPPRERAIGYIRIRDLADGKVGRCSNWLAPEVVSVEARWALLPGDILLSKSGTIGKAALVRNGAVGSVAANGLYVLRADKGRLDPGFLLAYLASPACQNWLAAQSRGAVIQHLNRVVLDDLPIPLPPLSVQTRAAAQYQDFGTDALAFLAMSAGTGASDRLTAWLAELNSKTPTFVAGMDATPAVSQFEPLVDMASTARRWVEQEQVPNDARRWLMPLVDALIPLIGVAQIPEGPALLTVLQAAERSMLGVLEHASGHVPTESQARAIAERMRNWLRSSISDLVEAGEIRLVSAPAALVAGNFTEFVVGLENDRALPLRSFRIETLPDWGVFQVPYLAERQLFSLNLRGDVPKLGNQLSLQLNWSATNLVGQPLSGVVEIAVQIVTPEEPVSSLGIGLGGSPYVTGSPLQPQHGHAVFFGREALISQISRQISTNGNVVLLEGNRRAGKTSILRHLEGSAAIHGWLCVYSDLQEAEGDAKSVGVPTPEVYRLFASSIAKALAKLGIEVPLPNGEVIGAGKPPLRITGPCREGIGHESPFSDFRDYLEKILSLLEPLGLSLVLMLDEFDKLQEGIDNGVTSPQVPENIRSLIQSYPRFSAILTGSRRLKRLREEYWSALYGLGTSIPVTALDMQSARDIVTEPVRGRLVYSNEAIERVVDITAGHPYLLQCLCNRLFDFAVQTKSHSITLSIVEKVAASMVRDNEHFASLWDYAGLGPTTGRRRRQLILLLCAQSFKLGTHTSFGTLHEQLAQSGVDVDDDVLDADLAYLRELELIDLFGGIGEGHYRLAIPMMTDWIEQQQDAVILSSRALTEAEEENV